MLVLTKFLYGAETWLAQDEATQRQFHSIVMKLYRRLGRVPHDEHLTDDELLNAVEQSLIAESLGTFEKSPPALLLHAHSCGHA